jgi:hypothetical protein
MLTDAQVNELQKIIGTQPITTVGIGTSDTMFGRFMGAQEVPEEVEH